MRADWRPVLLSPDNVMFYLVDFRSATVLLREALFIESLAHFAFDSFRGSSKNAIESTHGYLIYWTALVEDLFER